MPAATEIQRTVSEAVNAQSAEFTSRLNELEDRSRRDNLIFYGIPDNSSETWAESEGHIRDICSRFLEFELPEGAISRAHRLGSFAASKTRPIITKFWSFKTKDHILSLKNKLKNTDFSLSEDFCQATRHCRKKLIEFGKANGQSFSLRYNKLVMNKKQHGYCAITNSVHALDSSRQTGVPRGTQPPDSGGASASSSSPETS